MAIRTLPSRETLNQLLRYDPETGKLYWRPRPLGLFDSPRIGKGWNTRFAGQEAFHEHRPTGYRIGCLFGAFYKAHRIIWKMTTGEEPVEIDHIDGDGFNNSWRNLRNVGHAENGRNTKRHKNNTVGSGGIHRLRSGNYHVRIMKSGKRTSIGTYATLVDATAARLAAEREFGFHANHGR